MSSRIQRRVVVSGRVQGVGFRAATLRQVVVQGYVLTGYVKNLPDGRVEAVFQGEPLAVLGMISWMKHGPSSAHVDQIEVTEESIDHSLAEFGIRN